MMFMSLCLLLLCVFDSDLVCCEVLSFEFFHLMHLMRARSFYRFQASRRTEREDE